MKYSKSKRLWLILGAVLGLIVLAVAVLFLLKPPKNEWSDLPMEEQAWFACEDFFGDLIEIEAPGAAYETMGQQPGHLTEDGTYELTLTVRYEINGSEQVSSHYCRAVFLEDEKEWGIVQFQAVQ